MPDPSEISHDRTSDNHPLINQIGFEDDGSVIIQYLVPALDLKANGVMQQHVLSVPRGEDYDDEIDSILDAAIHLLRDCFDDMPNLMSLPEAAAIYTQNKDEEEEEDDR